MRKNRNNRPPEVGARGLLRLRCPCCGKEFGTYLHVSQMSIGCRCGATISLERGLAHYEFECGCCGLHAKSIADLKTGMSNSMDEIAKTVADTVSEMDMSDEATKSAKETIQGFIDGASSMMPRVQEAYAKIASAASTALAGSNERYNVNHGIPGYAVGTEDAAPGFALVGEHGPELVYFNGGESVLTASETRREMESASVTPMSAELPESNGSSSARSTVPISLSPVYHISGISDTAELQNVLNAQNDSLRELVLEIVKDAEDDDFRGRYA